MFLLLIPLAIAIIQLLFYAICTPGNPVRAVSPSRFDKPFAVLLYVLAYTLSILRLPFALGPYFLKVVAFLLTRKRYTVSHYADSVEILRILGDIINWGVGVGFIYGIRARFPLISEVLYLSAIAEAIRLVFEKEQMILSAFWQVLPHRRFARSARLSTKKGFAARYCLYYRMEDDERAAFILNVLHGKADADASTKLSYIFAFRIVEADRGLRGGVVRDVARGEVYIHRRWTSDPFLLIGLALRRSPWLFDPRYLRRPFYYRSESNRLASLFVWSHARYSPTYALYQFGHEIKAGRYDLFYRVMRWMGLDVEPKVQADGSFRYDQFLTWVEAKLSGVPVRKQRLLWSDIETLTDVGRRLASGEQLSPLEIATQYTYPLCYVEDVLWRQIMTLPDFYNPSLIGTRYEPDFARAYQAGLDAYQKPGNDDSPRVLLWLIDAQIDFVFPDGRLAVPGAVKDTQRTVEFIYRNTPQITHIAASLDTHLPTHIFFAGWWQDTNGAHPAPYTVITAEQVARGEWLPTQFPDWSRDYVSTLEQVGKKQLMIWPFHCMEGTSGRSLVPALSEAIQYHSGARHDAPTYLTKGTIPETEFYSVVEPEVKVLGRPDGTLNLHFLEFLVEFDLIYIAGQARSHCVLETMRSTLRHFANRPHLVGRLRFLDDCTSSIVGFEESTEAQIAEFVREGIRLVKAGDAIS